jgi:hypothetical protein
METYKQNNRAIFSRFAAISLLLSFLTTAASSSFAQTASRVFYNQEVSASQYSLESHPLDPNKVRNTDAKISYIKDSTYVVFNELIIPDDKKPVSITINYASGGAGGKVKFVADGYNSSRTLGIALGEFELPSTGGWNNYSSVTFQVDPNNFELNYLRGIVPLRLEFKNPASSEYLFDIVNFKIANASKSSPLNYNQTIPAVLYSSESDPLDENKVRNMGHQVGYIKNGTNIKFDNFGIPSIVPKTNIPSSVTITYSSGGSGGSVRFTADAFNSNRTLGIVIGEFNLPNTGGWGQFKTVTFPVPYNFELEYLRGTPPLKLDFKNATTTDYLFDIVDFKINSLPTP